MRLTVDLIRALWVVSEQFANGTLTHWEYLALREWLLDPSVLTLGGL